MNDMIELSDADILARLSAFEDAFVERKSTGDARDVLKTAVAFANSTPVGYPAILFYGVTDKGEPEGKANLDTLQKTISSKLADAYPAIYYVTKVLEKDGKQFLAVIIPGSESRPHFAGQSFVREGSKSVSASKEQFQRLIAERNSKVYEILKWKGQQVSLQLPRPQTALRSHVIPKQRKRTAYMNDCNQHYVTVQIHRLDKPSTYQMCFPLSQVEVSFDAKAKRLMLTVTHWY